MLFYEDSLILELYLTATFKEMLESTWGIDSFNPVVHPITELLETLNRLYLGTLLSGTFYVERGWPVCCLFLNSALYDIVYLC